MTVHGQVSLWNFLKINLKKKEIKKLLHNTAINSNNINTVGAAYCIDFLLAVTGKPPTIGEGSYYEQGTK